jgi:hypothetical protein
MSIYTLGVRGWRPGSQAPGPTPLACRSQEGREAGVPTPPASLRDKVPAKPINEGGI